MEEMDGGIIEASAIAADGSHLDLKHNGSSQKPEHIIAVEEEEMAIPEEIVHPSSLEEVLADCLDSDHPIQDMKGLSDAEHSYMSSRGTMSEVLDERNWDRGFDFEGTGASNNRTKIWDIGKLSLQIYERAQDDVRKSGHKGPIFWKGRSHTDSDIDSKVTFSEILQSHDDNLAIENLGSDYHGTRSNDIWGCSGTRTKILSKSGFSEFFIKKTLEGKGITCRSPANGDRDVRKWDQDNSHASGYTALHSDIFMASKENSPSSHYHGGIMVNNSLVSSNDGVILREWLSSESAANKASKLYIFSQVLEFTNFHHSRGVALKDLRPSSFKLNSSNKIEYLGRFLSSEMPDSVPNEEIFKSDCHRGNKRQVEITEKSKSPNFSRWKRPFFPGSDFKPQATSCLADVNASANEMIRGQFYFSDSGVFNKKDLMHQMDIKGNPDGSPCSFMYERPEQQGNIMSDNMEDKWYASPEELSMRNQTLSSNIYHLGVLLFELLGSFNSEQARHNAMWDLRNRILPPQFLSECPMEAGICLWLLHPESSSRPKISDILHSELVRNLKVVTGTEPSSTEPTSPEGDEAESDLLFHFLLSLEETKMTRFSKLVNDIKFLEGDIEEIERRNLEKVPTVTSSGPSGCTTREIRKHAHCQDSVLIDSSSVSPENNPRLGMNFGPLENVYFSTRFTVSQPKASLTKGLTHQQKNSDALGDFFKGLCKYGRYNKFEVCSVLRSGDFTSSSGGVVCSLSFDRDEDYFAAAGISKKIKVFDFHSLFGDSSSDIHYPVAEMLNNSKLSCICWNHYIKNFMASTDYDGIVKLWDVCKAQEISQYTGHQKRVWSVDFSHLDPTKFVSGSDDYCVKLWSLNEKKCTGTIRNKANICCVQFGGADAYKVGFGSADFQAYIYDVRNSKVPWCVLSGHRKAVSYVKFLDNETLVSASTDNTLRVWDIGKATSTTTSALTPSLILSGHTNLKNFVGLSVSSDGYIVCGSETNEVFSYYRSIPMPIASYIFGYIDPASGKEMEDDGSGGLFVSSVCWRGKSDYVIAANSTGLIKVLKMV